MFDIPDPQRFVAGTVGQPGERVFYLQARSDAQLVTVAVEKEQVSILAERLDDLLDELSDSVGAGVIPDAAPGLTDVDPLDAPIDEEFRVGAMAIGWDPDTERVIIETHAVSEIETDVPDIGDDDDDEQYGDTLRVRLTGEQARSFVARARAVVSAGRPPCPFCSLPLDPSGHICPRANGYRRRG